jgi:hypothetical protein
MEQRSQSPIPSIQTWYITFSFRNRQIIGVDTMDMSGRWVEIKARTRSQALHRAMQRFGYVGWQLHSEEAFTPDRRRFYPDGCCLVLISD